MRIAACTTAAEAGWAIDGSDNAALYVLGIALTGAGSTGGDSTGGGGIEPVSVLLQAVGQASTVA